MTISVDLPKDEGDDPKFIACVRKLIYNLVTEIRPKDVYAMRINKWFDQKWLRYSGKGLTQSPQKGLGTIQDTLVDPEVYLDEQFQKHLTFPPFNPKQMGTRYYWALWDDGIYGGVEKPRWPKIHFLRHSSVNLQNRVESFSKSGLFVWYSSNTARNEKGSLMTYFVKDGDAQAWYASLSKEKEWDVEKTKGTSKELVKSWLAK